MARVQLIVAARLPVHLLDLAYISDGLRLELDGFVKLAPHQKAIAWAEGEGGVSAIPTTPTSRRARDEMRISREISRIEISREMSISRFELRIPTLIRLLPRPLERPHAEWEEYGRDEGTLLDAHLAEARHTVRVESLKILGGDVVEAYWEGVAQVGAEELLELVKGDGTGRVLWRERVGVGVGVE